MFRYVAIAWNPGAAQQSRDAERLIALLYGERTRWQSAFSVAGLVVLQVDARGPAHRTKVLHGQAGVVLGTLFPNVSQTDLHDAPQVVALDEKESFEISRTRGMHLVQHYWGDYVAFIKSAEGFAVLKSPTGSLPCYVTRQAGLTVAFSSTSDCRALGELRFTVNWSYVYRRLVTGGIDSDETSINEIQKLAGGECLHIDREAPRTARLKRQLYWSPATFARSPEPIVDPELAAHALHRTVRNCVNALASDHSRAVHRLSGGFDSSIILGCLAKAQQDTQLTCFTYFNPRGRADERPWARAAAKFVGAKTFEWAYDPRQTRMDKLLKLAPSVDPPRLLRHLDWSSAEHALASELGATAVFSGDGGDSVFGREAIDYAADQDLRLHGFRPALLRLAAQVAVYRDRTVWSVLGGAIRRRVAGRKMNDRREAILHTSRLVRRDLRESLVQSDRFPHPWFSGERDIPWDTIFQVGGLLVSREFYHPAVAPSDPAPETLAPLLSQPVVELCLRIPIAVRFEHGKDRGLARRAFVQEAPKEILRRHWKDRGPTFFGELLQNNIAFVREVLLDGILVREDLLDRAAVERALAGTTNSAELYLGEILEHLSVELWLRHWTEERDRKAA